MVTNTKQNKYEPEKVIAIVQSKNLYSKDLKEGNERKFKLS
jgi:hypothetical protein